MYTQLRQEELRHTTCHRLADHASSSAIKFEAQFVILCFVLKIMLGVVKSFVAVASSFIDLPIASPKRDGEALEYIFVIRAARMLEFSCSTVAYLYVWTVQRIGSCGEQEQRR